jgi:ATP-dependent helicase STH1/SNF2
MDTIQRQLISQHYDIHEQLIADFRLMFANAKKFNLEGSQVYIDATTLEDAFEAKVQEMLSNNYLDEGNDDDPNDSDYNPNYTFKYKVNREQSILQVVARSLQLGDLSI